MNIDKGDQSVGSKNAIVLGHIGNTNADCTHPRYEAKILTSKTPMTVTTDASGSLWLLFGIDSGFEAASRVYYQSASITASPM